MAYGAVGYLRASNEDPVEVSLMMSKNRVAPLKRKTIPKLELLAAVIAIRLFNLVKSVMRHFNSPVKKTLWSDSQIVLYWIQAGNSPNQFTTRRVQEILGSSVEGIRCELANVNGTMNKVLQEMTATKEAHITEMRRATAAIEKLVDYFIQKD